MNRRGKHDELWSYLDIAGISSSSLSMDSQSSAFLDRSLALLSLLCRLVVDASSVLCFARRDRFFFDLSLELLDRYGGAVELVSAESANPR